MHLVLLDIARPVFDRPDGGHRFNHLQECVAWIALAGRQRILEDDQRQAGGVGNALEVLDRHGWALAQRERGRRENKKRRCSALIGHARDAGGLDTAVGPYAVDERQTPTDFVLRDFEHATLFLEAARGDLGRMGVNRNGRQPFGSGNVGEVLAEALFIDRQVIGEWQQNGGDHALRGVMGMAGHCALLTATCHKRSVTNDLSQTIWRGRFEVPRSERNPVHRPYIMPAAAFAKTPPMPEIEGPALLDNRHDTPPIAPADNPLLLGDWTGGVPPFSRVRAEHFLPAYAHALAEHAAEIAAIASRPEPPTFANTIAALELSGRTLERIDNVFYLLAGAHTDDALQEIERAISPQLARHWSQINTNAALFRLFVNVTATTEHIGLDAEQKRVVERYHARFRR